MGKGDCHARAAEKRIPGTGSDGDGVGRHGRFLLFIGLNFRREGQLHTDRTKKASAFLVTLATTPGRLLAAKVITGVAGY